MTGLSWIEMSALKLLKRERQASTYSRRRIFIRNWRIEGSSRRDLKY